MKQLLKDVKLEGETRSRGLSEWEFILLKEILSSEISFEVNIKRHKDKYQSGAISIKPTKNEQYYWNKEKFERLLYQLDRFGADYNRVGIPDSMIHQVFCNGFSFLRFKVDEANRLHIPGLVPNRCVKHSCFSTRSGAENFMEKNHKKKGADLYIGVHPKDGYVVYSLPWEGLHQTDWQVTTKVDIHEADIWGKKDILYRFRSQSMISGFAPQSGLDDERIAYCFESIMVYAYFDATGTELVEEREYLPWNDEEEVRNVEIPGHLLIDAEASVEKYPPFIWSWHSECWKQSTSVL